MAAARQSDEPNHDWLKEEKTGYRRPYYGMGSDGLPMHTDVGVFPGPTFLPP